MKLTDSLHSQGYDLICGPTRNHKPLQLWVKKAGEEVELYYDRIDQAFKSSIKLNDIQNPVLSINSELKDEYAFNIGLTALEEILKSIGLGSLNLSMKIKSGKKIAISYDNATSIEYPTGEIDDYFVNADFNHANLPLLKNANRNNILVVTGIIYAQSFKANFETNYTIEDNLLAEIKDLASGKIDFTKNSNSTLDMSVNGNLNIPIAVKANELVYTKGHFKKTKLLTDEEDLF